MDLEINLYICYLLPQSNNFNILNQRLDIFRQKQILLF